MKKRLLIGKRFIWFICSALLLYLTAMPVIALEDVHTSLNMSSQADTAISQGISIGQEDMIYFIMTDRFYDGDASNNQDVKKDSLSSYHGGDFQGIIDKLDYIKDLGFTAIWISPVVENQVAGYHGYWATDFYKTNPHFGTLEKLKELVVKAHEKDIKVIVDLVVNHTGQLHPWVSDPKYSDWFHDYGLIIDYSNQEEVEQGSLSSLPDLKQENPEVKKYLIDMAKWWIAQTGIDGYRLDTVRHVSKEFWVDFCKEVKKDYPDFYLIGEVFDGNAEYVGAYQETGLDGLVDFPTYFAIYDVFAGSQQASRLADAITEAQKAYTDKYKMGTFIDNHDVPRFVSQITNGTEGRLKQALTFMMTYTGIPVMYYGTEIALDGGADPDNRRDMDFNAKSAVTEYVKVLTKLRSENLALTHGDLKLLQADDNFLSFSRSFEGKTIITSFNISDDSLHKVLDLSEYAADKKYKLVNLIDQSEVEVDEGKAAITLASRGSGVYMLTPDGAALPSNTGTIAISAGIITVIAGGAIAVLMRSRAKKKF